MTNLLPIATGGRTWAALRVYMRPERGRIAAAVQLLVAGTVAGLAGPPLLGRIVDLATARSDAGSVVLTGALLVAAALLDAALAAWGIVLLIRSAETVLARLRERFLGSALRMPLEQVELAGTGDLTSRVTNDVTVVAQAARVALPEFARAGLTIGLTLVGMAVLDWRFFIAALIAVPVQVHTMRWYTRRAIPLYASQRVAVAAQQHHLLGTIDGASTVRAFRLAAEHTERVRDRSQSAVDLLLAGIRLQTRFYTRLHIGEFAGLAAVLATGYFMVRNGDVTIGTATAAALYFHGLFGPINVALATVDDAQVAISGLNRLVGVAELPDAVPAQTPGSAGNSTASAIEVSDLSFAYHAGRPVLHHVSLTVQAGERVAVVGSSGAGKTTLAKIVAGIHQPASGSVGVPGGDVVLITQEVHVFAGPLADDLRLARPGATDDELRLALAAVDALAWAEELPDGLETEVGEGGHSLTVAQAQQIAFARLILADPAVVILDEATAEAGSAGARMLERAAAAALTGRTALVVAHRLTQAAAADRVVLMDAGQIVEVGRHDDLVAAGGAYAALWAAWSDQRPATPPPPRQPRAQEQLKTSS